MQKNCRSSGLHQRLAVETQDVTYTLYVGKIFFKDGIKTMDKLVKELLDLSSVCRSSMGKRMDVQMLDFFFFLQIYG